MEPLKSCNCKASKCAKAYCDCFAAKQYCGPHCHCIGCQNYDINDPANSHRSHENHPNKLAVGKAAEEPSKLNRGCACKKSGCTKKYCQCFNAGLACTEHCKCLQCHNSDNYAHRRGQKPSRPNQNIPAIHLNHKVHSIQKLHDTIQQITNFDKASSQIQWLKQCAFKFHQILIKQPQNPPSSISKQKQITKQFVSIVQEIVTNRQKAQQKSSEKNEDNAENNVEIMKMEYESQHQ